MEKISSFPSAVSEPLWALHMCDNKCRAEGFKFHEVAFIDIEGGAAAHTINLGRICYNERRATEGDDRAEVVPRQVTDSLLYGPVDT